MMIEMNKIGLCIINDITELLRIHRVPSSNIFSSEQVTHLL